MEYHKGSYSYKHGKPMTENEIKVQEVFWYKEPKLMHLNPNYSRELVMKNLRYQLDTP